MIPIAVISSDGNNHTYLQGQINCLSPVLAIALVGLFTSTSLAVPLTQNKAQSPETHARSQMNVIYVSSSIGNDSGDGSKTVPLKTISSALKRAEPHTVILLAPGNYTRQTGEVFPLILPPKITIKGNYINRGQNVWIEGGGDFDSPTLNRKNVTIVASNGSNLSGITVTNPNFQGYGLWIESNGCVISKNTFVGNTLNGISVVGSNLAIIQENDFSENGVSGVTIYDNSQPEIRDNLFQNNGVGVKISDDAAPKVVGNRLVQNNNGIVIQGNSRPILRGNYIEGNRQDGVVAIAQSLPDLGNSQAPGRNTIRNNGRYDIYNNVVGKIIPAYGNVLGGDRNYGSIDIAGKIPPPSPIPPIAVQNDSNSVVNSTKRNSEKEQDGVEIVSTESNFSNSEEKAKSRDISISISNNIRSQTISENSATEMVIIPVPPPDTQIKSRGNLQSLLQNNSNYQNTGAIEVPVSSPESRGGIWERLRNLPPRNSIPSFEETTPLNSAAILPVPTANIPLGSGGYIPPGISRNRNSAPTMSRLSLGSNSQDRAVALGLRFRVVVNLIGFNQRLKLRRLVPDSFLTNINGKSLMQAGAFRSRLEADILLRKLRNNGLNAEILPVK
ncbi:MAG: DUF1565 domain-containing protein [Microcoleaceae cyanobacterium MO_207.B10]|nr:DUF1565 domain-containing protein [Microcoleaceae cyanobacterium MO_207.B10]